MRFSSFRDHLDNVPVHFEADWRELVELLTTHTRTPCHSAEAPCKGHKCQLKFGAAWSPASYPDGVRRHKDNVAQVGAFVVDLDELKPEKLVEIMASVEARGLAFILHSSHSFDPANGVISVRLILPLSRPVAGSAWPKFWPRAMADLGLLDVADGKAKDASRLYFLPSCPEGGPDPIAEHGDGKALDVDTVSASGDPAPAPKAQLSAPTPALPDAAGPANLDELRNRLKSLRLSYARGTRDGDAERHAILDALLKGEPIAQEGGRDDALNKATSILATALPADVPEAAIMELLRPSVQAMPGGPVDETGRPWMDHAAYKFGRARERRMENDRRAREFDAAVRARLCRESAVAEPEAAADPSEDPAGPYSDEKLELWAGEQGCLTEEEFSRRWIIQRQKAFWVFVGGRYRAPISKDDLAVSLPRDLARAPVALKSTDKDGNERPLSVAAILDHYATVARDVQASLALQRSYYDAETQTFFEAVRPLRRLQPREHPEIHAWLELLGGKHGPKLLDWVACVMRLERQAAAIYIDGPPGCGKNLLAAGLARLWTPGGPADLKYALAGHNDVLTVCPLVFADEQLPQQRGITAELRRLIGSTARNLNRKFLPACNLDGAIRVIIAGNNDRLLDTGEDLSANDLDAVAGRFIYIQAPQEATEYLLQLGGPPVVGAWITENKIAEHALWLRDTRKVNEGARFLVEGEAQEFHEHLATGSGLSGLVCEWLVRWLADGSSKSTYLLVGEGEIWANTEAMAGEQTWLRYVPSAKVPSATKLGRALANLAKTRERVLVSGKQLTFHRIKPELILNWAERAQVGDPDALRARLKAPNPTVAAAKAARGSKS